MANQKNKLPEYVDVLGVRFQVQLLPKIDEAESAGETAAELRIIKIADYQDTRRRWTTLMHEVLHAALAVTGVASVLEDGIEEVIVQTLEHTMEQFLMAHGKELQKALEVQQ